MATVKGPCFKCGTECDNWYKAKDGGPFYACIKHTNDARPLAQAPPEPATTAPIGHASVIAPIVPAPAPQPPGIFLTLKDLTLDSCGLCGRSIAKNSKAAGVLKAKLTSSSPDN